MTCDRMWVRSVRAVVALRRGLDLVGLPVAVPAAHRARIEFGRGSDVPAGLAAREIGRDELVLVVAPGHPWVSRRRHPRAAELAATSLITREPGSGTREAFERALAEHAEGAVALPLLEVSSTTAIKAAVVGGIGPAVLS